jgi:nucleotide-binding universal stress UspA family protein
VRHRGDERRQVPEEVFVVQRIVVGVDGSPAAVEAARWAALEAAGRDADLEVVHAWSVPPVVGLYDAVVVTPEPFEAAAAEVLRQALAEVDAVAPAVRRRGEARIGAARSVLVDASAGADLLVVGARGRTGMAGLLLGSVSDHVLHHAPCSVVIVPATPATGTDVVVGVDGSPSSRAALAAALEEARRRRARVRAVVAWSTRAQLGPEGPTGRFDAGYGEADAAAVLQDALAHLDAGDVEVVPAVVCDGPASALLAQSRDAALVVVGARGLGAIERVLVGSVSRQVAHRSEVPVLVVRPGAPTAA